MPKPIGSAAVTGLPEDIYARCAELELEVRRARNMAAILARLIADSMRPGCRGETRPDFVYLEDVYSEAIDFAASDVADRLRALEKVAEALTVAMGNVRFEVMP